MQLVVCHSNFINNRVKITNALQQHRHIRKNETLLALLGEWFRLILLTLVAACILPLTSITSENQVTTSGNAKILRFYGAGVVL